MIGGILSSSFICFLLSFVEVGIMEAIGCFIGTTFPSSSRKENSPSPKGCLTNLKPANVKDSPLFRGLVGICILKTSLVDNTVNGLPVSTSASKRTCLCLYFGKLIVKDTNGESVSFTNFLTVQGIFTIVLTLTG